MTEEADDMAWGHFHNPHDIVLLRRKNGLPRSTRFIRAGETVSVTRKQLEDAVAAGNATEVPAPNRFDTDGAGKLKVRDPAPMKADAAPPKPRTQHKIKDAGTD